MLVLVPGLPSRDGWHEQHSARAELGVIDSNADTLRTGIANPCDWPECPFAATHLATLPDGSSLEVCDVCLPRCITAGGVHIEWLDSPARRSA